MDQDQVVDWGTLVIREAGEIAMKEWRKGRIITQTEKGTDYGTVTKVDEDVEAFLIEQIRRQFPDHSIVAEESGGVPSRKGWTIDPVDGTSFMAHGLVDWSISLSRFSDGVVDVGFTLCPPTGELFHAVKGHGAFRNGESIHVSPIGNPKRTIVNLGQDVVRLYDRGDIEVEVIKGTRTHYTVGSTAIALCRLAEGKIDVAVHMRQSIWDVATASLLIPEAGGCFRTWDGNALNFADLRSNDVYADNGKLPQNWSFLT